MTLGLVVFISALLNLNPVENISSFLYFELAFSTEMVNSEEEEDFNVMAFEKGTPITFGKVTIERLDQAHLRQSLEYSEIFHMRETENSHDWGDVFQISDKDKNIMAKFNSPQFNHYYIDENQGLMLLFNQHFYSSDEFWLIDQDGTLLISGFFDENDKIESLNEIERGQSQRMSNRITSNIEQALSKVTQNQSLTNFYRVDDTLAFNETGINDEVNEQQSIKVVFVCGRTRAKRLNSIDLIQYEKSRNILKIIYSNDDEKFIWDSQKVSKNRLKKLAGFSNNLSTNTYSSCDYIEDRRVKLLGDKVLTWCQNLHQIRYGQATIWEIKQTNENREYAHSISADASFAESSYAESSSAESSYAEVTKVNPSIIDSTAIDSLLSRKDFEPIMTGQYQNGLKSGEWVYQDKEYDEVIKCQFDKGQLTGNCFTYGDDYQIKQRFSEGIAQGDYIYQENGLVLEECFFVDGFKNGRCVEYGEQSVETECFYQGESQIGQCSYYFLNSEQVEQQCEMFGELRHGICTNFSKAGEVIKTAHYQMDEVIWSD